jgi:hypothetical protein
VFDELTGDSMIQLDWVVSDQIVMMRIEGEPTQDEVIAALHELRGYLMSESLFVHVLLDDHLADGQPPNMLKLREVIRQTFEGTKIGWFLIVHEEKRSLVDFFAAVLAQIMKVRYQRFDSIDTALAFLIKQDSTLPDLGSIQIPEKYT